MALAAVLYLQDWRKQKFPANDSGWPQRTSVQDAVAYRAVYRAVKPQLRVRHKIEDELSAAIEVSKYILHLENNWDEENSSGYQEKTWLRAVGFLRDVNKLLLENFSCSMLVPRILPGPNGSVDLHWSSGQNRLLVNFPENEALPAGFYGDNFGKAQIKGTFDQLTEKSAIVFQLAEYCQ